MNCKKCEKCQQTFHTDSLQVDAFGDSSVGMCFSCLRTLKNDSSTFLLVEVPDIEGETFVYKNSLDELKDYVGEENIKILNQ